MAAYTPAKLETFKLEPSPGQLDSSVELQLLILAE